MDSPLSLLFFRVAILTIFVCKKLSVLYKEVEARKKNKIQLNKKRMKVDGVLNNMELDFANAMLAEVKLKIQGKEMTSELYRELIDEYEYVYVDSAIAGVKEYIESHESYFIDEQGLMRVKPGCNWFLAEFDGCKSSEYYAELNNMMR